MKNVIATNKTLVAQTYGEIRTKLYYYICKSIRNSDDAEDLTQDAFLKAMEYDGLLTQPTIKAFIFRIARNLVNDYLRHYLCVSGAKDEIAVAQPVYTVSGESEVCARDIAGHESYVVDTLPRQRRQIYKMSRYDEMSIREIAMALSISDRTVENHLRLGRKEVRRYVAKCIS